MNRTVIIGWAAFALAIGGYVWAVHTFAERFQPPPASVLIGTGCGPDRLTLAANEESDFPHNCGSIERVYIFEDKTESD